jgi:hypothetical protein
MYCRTVHAGEFGIVKLVSWVVGIRDAAGLPSYPLSIPGDHFTMAEPRKLNGGSVGGLPDGASPLHRALTQQRDYPLWEASECRH